eukprot:gene30522-35550_t
MGCLATRSPHRPVPIGLSVARVLSVEGSSVVLGGADIVDGSPILDIKPYLPFCDNVKGATAPSWVTVEAAEEPLKVAKVEISAEAAEAVHKCWTRKKDSRTTLYSSSDEYLELVKQVLSRDIRSLHKRLGLTRQLASYHVILDNIDITYNIDTDASEAAIVTVLDASVHTPSQKEQVGKQPQSQLATIPAAAADAIAANAPQSQPATIPAATVDATAAN